MSSILLFLLTFLFITNWGIIKLYLKAGFNFSRQVKLYNSELIKSIIARITPIEPKVYRVESPIIFAAMHNFPPIRPVISISSGALNKFEKEEIEWIVLHELGHYMQKHVIWLFLIFTLIGSTGMFIINEMQLQLSDASDALLLLLTALFFGVLFYQFQRITEYLADHFAIRCCADPIGVITAQSKMKNTGKSYIYRNPILQILFTPHIPYEIRAQMALVELKTRIRSTSR